MAIRRFLLNKLVRNKALDHMTAEGVQAKTEILSDNDTFLEAITQKMIEELEEIFSSETQEELIEEIADFEEVFEEFKKLVQITQEEIAAARDAKTKKKGNFSNRLYCEYLDVPETASNVISYVEGKEDKYPELDPKTNEYLNPNIVYDEEDEENEDYE